MLQLVSLWGQMSVKSVTADHADPSHNHVRADPAATLSLGSTPVDADMRVAGESRYRHGCAVPVCKDRDQHTCSTTLYFYRKWRTQLRRRQSSHVMRRHHGETFSEPRGAKGEPKSQSHPAPFRKNLSLPASGNALIPNPPTTSCYTFTSCVIPESSCTQSRARTSSQRK